MRDGGAFHLADRRARAQHVFQPRLHAQHFDQRDMPLIAAHLAFGAADRRVQRRRFAFSRRPLREKLLADVRLIGLFARLAQQAHRLLRDQRVNARRQQRQVGLMMQQICQHLARRRQFHHAEQRGMPGGVQALGGDDFMLNFVHEQHVHFLRAEHVEPRR